VKSHTGQCGVDSGEVNVLMLDANSTAGRWRIGCHFESIRWYFSFLSLSTIEYINSSTKSLTEKYQAFARGDIQSCGAPRRGIST